MKIQLILSFLVVFSGSLVACDQTRKTAEHVLRPVRAEQVYSTGGARVR